MARRRKLTGAAKAAFLRRMARGRRRAGLKNPRRKSRRARSSGCASLTVRVKNPRRRRARRNPARRVRRRSRGRRGVIQRISAVPMSLIANLLKGAGRTMAKRRRKTTKRRRRRNPGALLVNPRRRRRRRNPRRVSRRRRRNPSRRFYRRARRRNPGLASLVRLGAKDIMIAAIPATIGGFAIGFIDSKFLGQLGTVARTAGKLLTAFLVGTVGKRWLGPVGSGIATGAILGTIGHEFGVRAAGGMVAMTKKESVSQLIEQAATDAEMQAELGALLESDELEGSPADDFTLALEGGGTPSEYSDALAGEEEYAY